MKEEIVQRFLSKGKLLTPKALEMLSEEHAGSAVIEKYKDMIINEHDIIDSTKKPVQPGIKILKTLTAKKHEATAEDFAHFYRSKYEKTKNILVEKIQKPFTSINKLGGYRDEVYVVGIVREFKEKDGKKILEIEDLTGTIPVVFDEDVEAELDDVVAIRAISSKNVIFGKQIIYPDVPLRKPATGTGKACFVGGLKINEAPKADIENFFSWLEKQPVQNVFVVGDVGDLFEFERLVEKHCHDKNVIFTPGEKDTDETYPQLPVRVNTEKIISLSNPAIVEAGGLKILLIHKFDISMLKKRYLGKPNTLLDEDYLVLEEVPDIVCHGHADNAYVTNYKSITVVNSGSMLADFQPIIIDFETRDVQQVALKSVQK